MNTRRLHVVYIRPSKYDDEGYVIRFWRGVLPSNTLACLEGLTRALAEAGELGPGVEVTVDAYDDTVQRVPVQRIARLNRRPGTRVVVGFVGVQTNQFPRAADLARQFRQAGVQVMIGGFHVSGMLALFDTPSREIQELIDVGVTMFKGEAEAPGALAGILRDALEGRMRPIYDIKEFPELENAPVPRVNARLQHKFVSKGMATIDTSRGCPFNCSFCTIINVQGRKMRYRSADCVLKAIEDNYSRGIRVYFFTDDNFSRNPVWEAVFDGLIEMRARGIEIIFMMQTDTQAHRIPGFVEKAARAGCYLAFIGMESVNAANLQAVGKKQNHVNEYAAMVDIWRRNGVLVHVGYIIGLPHDTRESVRLDMDTLSSHVKVDFASLFMLTPLPGSRDHREMVCQGTPIDADHNNYDGLHETFRHLRMDPGEWRGAYDDAMNILYSKENIVNAMLRVPPQHRRHMFAMYIWYRFSALEGVHPMATGFYRLKDRKSRRPSFARENLLRYAWRRTRDAFHGARRYASMFLEFQEIWMLTRHPEDPRWATLADLRTRWAEVQQRISESSLAGRCEEASAELRGMLTGAAERLRQVSVRANLSVFARRRLRAKARGIESYLRSFDLQMPGWRRVVDAERYVADHILRGYEEVAIRYVAKRRRVDAFRREFLERVKSGRILTLDVGKAVYVCFLELVLSFRFGFEVLTHRAI